MFSESGSKNTFFIKKIRLETNFSFLSMFARIVPSLFVSPYIVHVNQMTTKHLYIQKKII